MKVLIVGHISLDIREGRTILGGPPLYQLPVFISHDVEVHIITSTKDSSKLPECEKCRFSIQPSQFTTTFEFIEPRYKNKLNEEDRILKLVKKASPIDYNFVNENIDSNYDIVIVSPIANELDFNTMELVADLSKNSFLDMQGIVRYFKKDGTAKIKFRYSDLEWALQTFNVVKISDTEFENIDQFLNPHSSKLVVTKAGHGYEIFSSSRKKIITTKPITNLIDSTGSGDIFLATFAYYYQENPLTQSIHFADQYAKENLNNVGIPDPSIFTKLRSNPT